MQVAMIFLQSQYHASVMHEVPTFSLTDRAPKVHRHQLHRATVGCQVLISKFETACML